MPDILHRISIDAPQERVHDLIATTEGVARWWTGRPLSGESSVGEPFSVYFGDAEQTRRGHGGDVGHAGRGRVAGQSTAPASGSTH